jgi:hypothetical protein
MRSLSRRPRPAWEETLEHQRQIGNCIARIEGKTDEAGPGSSTRVPDLPVIPESDMGEPPQSPAANFDRLYDESIREIASCTSVSATAESAGFFETRLVCDGNLLHKSSMTKWLYAHISPAKRARADEDARAGTRIG